MTLITLITLRCIAECPFLGENNFAWADSWARNSKNPKNHNKFNKPPITANNSTSSNNRKSKGYSTAHTPSFNYDTPTHPNKRSQPNSSNNAKNLNKPINLMPSTEASSPGAHSANTSNPDPNHLSTDPWSLKGLLTAFFAAREVPDPARFHPLTLSTHTQTHATLLFFY